VKFSLNVEIVRYYCHAVIETNAEKKTPIPMLITIFVIKKKKARKQNAANDQTKQ
jgi:hypothetical protein